MQKLLASIALVSGLLCAPVLASPVYRVTADVAQGISSNGLSVTLAPGQVMSINFSKLGEKISSITPGDRSNFVYSVSGSVVNLRRIKPLTFEGEYSTGADTTLIVSTVGAAGQQLYPIAIHFSDRKPGYSVVDITPSAVSEPETIPAARPIAPRVPLTTTLRPVPARSTVVAQVAILPEELQEKPVITPPVVIPNPPEIEKPAVTVAESDPVPAVLKPKRSRVQFLSRRVLMPDEVGVIAPTKKQAKAPSKVDPAPVYGRAPTPFSSESAKTDQLTAIAFAPKVEPVAVVESSAPDLTGHAAANALVRGLMVAKVPRYSSLWMRTQDAVYLLRKGKTLDAASNRARVPVQKLRQFIEMGAKRHAVAT